MNLRLFTCLLLIFSSACQEKAQEKELLSSIYHWKSQYKPSQESLARLKKAGIHHPYIHFFDIDYVNEQAVPKAVIRFVEKPKSEIIPVIYITNRTFKKMESEALAPLAKKTAEKIIAICQEQKLDFSEVQLDCDWSKSTKEKYFKFVAHFRKAFSEKIAITATLRLHQVKFKEQTGVPPVDRTMLMLYNVGDWTHIETPNSLFDPAIIDQYIFRLSEYPLPIDIALPIFSQCIVYRDGQFYTFLKNTTISKISSELVLTQKKDSHLWQLDKSADYQNKSFRVADVFREESANFAELNAVKNAVLARIQNKKVKIVLYDFDKKSLSNFSDDELKALLEYTP